MKEGESTGSGDERNSSKRRRMSKSRNRLVAVCLLLWHWLETYLQILCAKFFLRQDMRMSICA
jgi:hypothetical protein